MRLVLVSNESPTTVGVYVGQRRPTKLDHVASRDLNIPGSGIQAFGVEHWSAEFDVMIARQSVVVPFAATVIERVKAPVCALLDSAYLNGLMDGRRYWAEGNPVPDMIFARPEETAVYPFETRCITIGPCRPGPLPTDLPYSSRLLQGVFAHQEQLDAVLSADGGNSKIHVMSRAVANEFFRRHGGGVLEEGTFVLHPKREGTLVPFSTFHSDMLQEMAREVRVVMGRIGAKRLTIETIEGVSFGGSVVSKVPLRSGGLEVEGAKRSERTLTYEWGSPTFEPEGALQDCVWIHDLAGAMTIVDQRRTSDLIRFEEFSRVDTSFRVAVNLLKLFKAEFEWASESRYRYDVEFFPRTR